MNSATRLRGGPPARDVFDAASGGGPVRRGPVRVFRPPIVIRPGDVAVDRAAILDGAVAFAAESGLLPYLPATFAGLRTAVETVLSLPCVEVLLAVDADGACAGGLGLSVLPYLWNPQLLLGEELFLWAWPGRHRRWRCG